MKRTFQPSNTRRKRTHGFLARMSHAWWTQRPETAARQRSEAAHRFDPAEAAEMTARHGQGFPKAARIRRRREFLSLGRTGEKRRTGSFVCILRRSRVVSRGSGSPSVGKSAVP